MKRVLTVILLALTILVGGTVAEAKTPKKKAKSTSQSTKAITVNNNEYGYPDPLGHTYKVVNNGFTFIIAFDSPYSATFDVKYGRDRKIEAYGWSQEGDIIYMSDTYFHISPDGKQLTDVPSSLVLKIIK